MRRAAGFGLALGYALSWIMVCLSACMMESGSSKHGCCPEETGIRAVQRDCCSTAPTARPDATPDVDAPPPIAASWSAEPLVRRAAEPLALPVRAAASPPLVLRV